MKHFWRIIAMSLGQKSGKSDEEADAVAALRFFFALVNLITCGVIIAGVIRHWNN
jgi:hypothetical protein